MLLIALLVMTGWKLDWPTLLQLRPNWPPMQFNTALLFVLSTTALCHRSNTNATHWGLWLAVMAIALATLLQYASGQDFGIDQWLQIAGPHPEVSHPGRMSPLTAVCFLILAATGLLLGGPVLPAARAAALLSAVLLALGASTLLGYGLDDRPIIGWAGGTSMALHTALLFCALGAATLQRARENIAARDAQALLPLRIEFGLLGMILLSLLLWRAFSQHETARIRELQQIEARWLSSRISERLLAPLPPLRRMAARWTLANGSDERPWSLDALSLTRDTEGLLSVQWLDRERYVRRIEPISTGRALLGTQPNQDPVRRALLDQAIASGEPAISQPIKLLQGGSGLLIFVPLFANGENDGVLVGVIDLQQRLGPMVSSRPGGWLYAIRFDDAVLYADPTFSSAGNPRFELGLSLPGLDPRWRLHSRPATATVNTLLMPDVLLGSLLALVILLHLAAQFASASWQRARALGQARGQLEESLQRAQVILDNTADAIVSVDAHERIRSFNAAAERVFGWQADAVIGQPLSMLFVDAPRADGASTGWIDMLQESRPNLRGLHRDGEVRNLESALATVSIEGRPHRVVTLRDVTERGRARALAQEASERFRLAADAAGIGIWELRLLEDRLIWDDWMYRIFGYPTNDRRPPVELWHASLHPDDSARVDAEVAQALAKGTAFESEFRIIRGDGEAADIKAFARVLHNPQGLAERLIGVNFDISERKRLDRMKGEFVATVSHELRTPLTSISGALALLGSGALGPLGSAAEQLLQVARNNALRLTQLINDLLDMEKFTAGGLSLDCKPIALAPLLEQALQSNLHYAEPLGVRFVLIPGPSDIQVLADSGRLQQVLANFLSNAAKFSPEHGQVELSWSVAEQRVRVAVTDHGSGIPEQFRGRIFQKFSQADSSDTRRRGGTGLGLAISRELIERMGGRIGFDSTPGEGSCFWFELPRIDPTGTAAATESI